MYYPVPVFISTISYPLSKIFFELPIGSLLSDLLKISLQFFLENPSVPKNSINFKMWILGIDRGS